MLKAKLKLSKLDLDLILNQRKTRLLQNIQTQYFDLKIFQNPETIIKKELKNDFRINNFINSFKSTVIIAKKTFKKSTERNKIKRRFYSTVEKYLSENVFNTTNNKIHNNPDNRNKNLNLIFYPKKDSLNIKFSVLQQEVYNVLESKNIFE